MLINFVRAIILYIIVLATTRIMGKREIGQLQPYEFVIQLMIANLATIPMGEIGVPLLSGIIPIVGLLTMHLVIAFFNLKSEKFRSAICGKPRILIHKGRIDENALKKERLTIAELEKKLREKDIFYLSDVEYAILETNGDITVITKPEKRNTTPKDFNIKPEYEGLPYNLILDGKIVEENLAILGKDYKWLEKQLKKFKVTTDNILVATINAKGEIFYQEKTSSKN